MNHTTKWKTSEYKFHKNEQEVISFIVYLGRVLWTPSDGEIQIMWVSFIHISGTISHEIIG